MNYKFVEKICLFNIWPTFPSRKGACPSFSTPDTEHIVKYI